MRLVKVDKASDINLGDNISVEFRILGTAVDAVILTDKVNDTIYTITKSDSYSGVLQVWKDQSIDEEVHIFVVGKLFGTLIDKCFGKKGWEAESEAQKYIDNIYRSLKLDEEVSIKVIERTVLVHHETGLVVGYKGTVKDHDVPVPKDQDIPF